MLAHSARRSRGIPAQGYSDHVRRVVDLATENAKELARYSPVLGERLVEAVRQAGEYHDLGKLDLANQAVLRSGSGKIPLPINHVDAGAAYLLRQSYNHLLAASLIYSHHAGLPDFIEQSNRNPDYILRDEALKSETDQKLSEYLKNHHQELKVLNISAGMDTSEPPNPLSSLVFRFTLSCLVDADHQDTARHYGHHYPDESISLCPEVRLALLDRYVDSLGRNKRDERSRLRKRFYDICRQSDTKPSMYACDAPVGSGKTTAVMAHLLLAAESKRLRRIFVVLPFTNIIDQSVNIYRTALVQIEETLDEVVAAHHHRVEFQNPDSRHLSFLWKPPVIVTTAVQFFETLAASNTAALRKLHQLPGSAIFIDEAHAALPSQLWPQAWLWLCELVEVWGCHIVLGSGSLNRFWELKEFSDPPISIPELVVETDSSFLMKYESKRVEYRCRPEAVDLEELLSMIEEKNGPRLLIVNTVQSAAVIAKKIEERFGRKNVEHLSTSLCPRDRQLTLASVKQRLENKFDNQWTLVATSCVEAGVDLSFRTGFRERCSLNSLIQTGGRVNREGDYDCAEVWDFQLKHIGLLRANPSFETSSAVLAELFQAGMVRPGFVTEAMRREVRRDILGRLAVDIPTAEKSFRFPEVSKKFKVIDTDTVTAIIDPTLIERLEKYEKVSPNELMRLSVQIYRYRAKEFALKEIPAVPGLFAWTLDYDDFIGFMAGVLAVHSHKNGGYFV